MHDPIDAHVHECPTGRCTLRGRCPECFAPGPVVMPTTPGPDPWKK